MNKDIFDWQRFVRVLLNDLMQLQLRRVGLISLGLAGIGVIVYVGNASEAPQANVDLAFVTFCVLLLAGGHIFTSMIFNDMHHPLERFRYLMLPCSNLERFVSRYLITAPFYVVYAIVLFKVFEVVANFINPFLFDVPPIPPLDFGREGMPGLFLGYFATHAFVFMGAIWFRSYSLIKTMATGMVFWTIAGILSFLAVRIFYWDSFISLFEMNPEGPFPNIQVRFLFDEGGEPTVLMRIGVIAFLLWVVFLAYLGLKEHEVQDGL